MMKLPRSAFFAGLALVGTAPGLAIAQGAAVLPPAATPLAAPAASPAVPAWSVTASPGGTSVRLSKTAIGDSAAFTGGCSRREGSRMGGAFTRYGGGLLQTVDGQAERVLFEVRAEEWKEAFAVQLRYSAASRVWEIAGGLPPVFVSSFSRGNTLSVLNSRRQEVFAFDLTGSSAAARAMRDACGLQYAATAG